MGTDATARKHRAARHKLKAHDCGNDRHNKTLSWMKKQDRKRVKMARTAR